MMMHQPAEIDTRFLALLRDNVDQLLSRAAQTFVKPGDLVLDVAPQAHEGVAAHLPQDATLETIDIDPDSGATYVGDICRPNALIPDARYDLICCTEVLEHTLQPFNAVAELRRMLRPGGYLFASTPFGFRIHGPLPDCWRFSEHGLRALFTDFDILEIAALDDPNRPLMPIHYTTIARRPI